MSAVAESTVPMLWECAGNPVPCMDHLGRIGSPTLSVYASWSPERTEQPPHVYINTVTNPFSLGLHLHPADARELAANLLRAADLADATQAALDAEKQTLEEGA